MGIKDREFGYGKKVKKDWDDRLGIEADDIIENIMGEKRGKKK